MIRIIVLIAMIWAVVVLLLPLLVRAIGDRRAVIVGTVSRHNDRKLFGSKNRGVVFRTCAWAWIRHGTTGRRKACIEAFITSMPYFRWRDAVESSVSADW